MSMPEPLNATKVGAEKATTEKLMEYLKAVVASAEEVRSISLIF